MIEGVRPSPAQPGGLVLVEGQGFDGLLSLLVAGRAPARITPVNDMLLAFVLPEDVPPGPGTVEIWFVAGPSQAIDIVIADETTGNETPHGSPVTPSPAPQPATATPEPPPPQSEPTRSPGPFVLPSVVPIPRTDSDVRPAHRGPDNGDRDGQNGNGRGNREDRPGRRRDR